MSLAPYAMRFIGVELDSISGRIARALHPGQDIRIESFRDTRLPEGRIDAVIGNVPFADVKLDYRGQKLSLHDYFFAKSIDALKPGGVLALVTSHYTLDKQNAGVREYLAAKADFVGAIRLPADAFKREGTAVVTDILFLRRRALGEPANHADPAWLGVAPLAIEGIEVSINRYFLNHPEMVLGAWSRKDTLYGGEGYSVTGNGDLAGQLQGAIRHLPEFAPSQASPAREEAAPRHLHTPAAGAPHHRGQLLPPRRSHPLPVLKWAVRARHLRRDDAYGLRHDDRQAADCPGGPARPGTPRPAIAKRGVARDPPHGGTPGIEPGL